MSHMQHVRGFTLIETLIALVIAATAAAIIFSQLRTLTLRAEKEQAHQLALLQLLNDSLRLSYRGLQATSPLIEQDRLLLQAPVAGQEDPLRVEVRNFSVGGEVLPPVSIAYTPFQLFGVSRNRYTLHALAPGLKPAADALSAAGLTAPKPAAADSTAPPVAGTKPY